MTYKRVLLKLSGEALMGEKPYGIDPAIVQSIAEDVSKVVENNVQLAIVVGGGNIFRGLKGSADGMDRATADYVGMLATVMNAISLQDGLRKSRSCNQSSNSNRNAGNCRTLYQKKSHEAPRKR